MQDARLGGAPEWVNRGPFAEAPSPIAATAADMPRTHHKAGRANLRGLRSATSIRPPGTFDRSGSSLCPPSAFWGLDRRGSEGVLPIGDAAEVCRLMRWLSGACG